MEGQKKNTLKWNEGKHAEPYKKLNKYDDVLKNINPYIVMKFGFYNSNKDLKFSVDHIFKKFFYMYKCYEQRLY